MRLVLDASVALKWVVPEADSPKAIHLRDEVRRHVYELIAPDIFLGEVAHTLTKLERRGSVPVGGSEQLLDDVLTTRPVLYPYLSFLRRAREISSQTRSGFFDCCYVALAEHDGCEMVTADKKLMANAGTYYSFIRDLSSFP